MPERRPRVNLHAPVLPFDYPADGEPIWPCHDCLPWHVEVVVEEDQVLVREWHAVDCPVLVDDEAPKEIPRA